MEPFLVPVAPTKVKKIGSGKGNADKVAMYDAFQRQTGLDFRAWVGQTKGSLRSPVSDCVDAYFVSTCV